ncbi:MAG TPA: C4-type zinc ribbon domain-containing protein [Candidatus Dormibacteraeota bacterium]|nr:C4-type zinc ribbon domain-containing protein [Candidatus Dormibacteraeota bacterium]
MKVAEVLAAIEALERRREALLVEQEDAAQRAKTDPTVRQLRQRRAGLETDGLHQTSALKQLELEVAELAGRARSHEKAIYDGSVRHPADLQRRQHELETLRGKIQLLEENELAQMEGQERTAAELAEVVGQLAEREQEVEKQRTADRLHAPQLIGEISSMAEERSRLAESVTATQLRTYERTAARRRPAVAKVVGGTCTGCRLPLPSRLIQEARQDQLVTCENCERILLL